MIASERRESRLPRGKDERFKLELLNELIQDAGGPTEVTATRRLQAEIIATVSVVIAKPVMSARGLPVGASWHRLGASKASWRQYVRQAEPVSRQR